MILVIDEDLIMVLEAPMWYYKNRSIGWGENMSERTGIEEVQNI